MHALVLKPFFSYFPFLSLVNEVGTFNCYISHHNLLFNQSIPTLIYSVYRRKPVIKAMPRLPRAECTNVLETSVSLVGVLLLS